MTEFATIHGIPLPVKNEEWSRRHQRVGNMRERTNGGRLRDGRIALKDKWTGTTPLLTPAEAAPLIGLLNAEGHVFSFDADVYSSKGLIWVAAEPARDLTNKKFGAAAGSFVSGTTYSLQPGFTGDQTVLIWRRPGAGAFDHYGITRTAAGTIVEVKNGVVGSYTTSNWLTFGGSTISLLGKNDAGTNTTVQGDDFVVLPFLLTPAQIAATFAQTVAWGDIPELRVNGDGFGSGSFTVMGEITGETYMQGTSEGVWYPNLVEIEFTLDEV